MGLEFSIGFLKISLLDILEILLIGSLLYKIYMLMYGSMALKVMMGFLLIYFFYLVVRTMNMSLLTMALGNFINIGFLVVAIVFQQEIRKFLFLIGGTTLSGHLYKFSWFTWKNSTIFDISPIVDALKLLGGSNIGALIVMSKADDLKFYEDSGDRLDAIVSKRLLLSIFNKNSPLHDGSVIIGNNKIVAARCILPVTERDDIAAQYGLRHRAAIGISEVTSALVLVVSEETGQMAVVQNGLMKNNLSVQEIRSELKKYYKIDKNIR